MSAEQKTKFYDLEHLISDFNLLDFHSSLPFSEGRKKYIIKGVVRVYTNAMLSSETGHKKRAFKMLNEMLKGNLIRCYMQDSKACLEVKFASFTRNYFVYNLNLAIHSYFSLN